MVRNTKIVRGIAAVLTFCLSLEVCARVDDSLTYGAPFTATYNHDSLYTDDVIGKRGKPYGHYRKWRLNSLGFRGPDLQPDLTRIICFGASETFGLVESEGMEYPRQLEKLLNHAAGSKRYEVVNAAYPALSLGMVAARMQEVAREVRPSVALIYAVPANYIWLPYLPKPGRRVSVARKQPFEFRIGERIRTLLKTLLPAPVQNAMREYEVRRDAAAFPVMDRLPEENVRKFREDIEQVVRASREHNITPVLLTHVNWFGPNASADKLSESDRRMLVSWRKFYPMLKEAGFLDMESRMNDAIRQIAAENNVPLIDLAGVIPATPGNFADFAHFTDQGASLVAREIAGALQPVITRTEAGPAAGGVTGSAVATSRHR